MQEYQELLDAYSKLDINTKRNEIMYEVEELFSLFHSLTRGEDALLHHEDDIGEEEFLNAAYAYLISTKENIGMFLNNK